MARAKALTEQQVFQSRTELALARREAVAEQIQVNLLERAMAGDRAMLGRRVGELVVAERAGDREALRSAVMEVCLVAAEWCVSLDLDGLTGR